MGAGIAIREAASDDGERILPLMPLLADFDVPASRNPDHLWQSDAAMLRRWIDGEYDCLVHVAERDGDLVGFTMVSLRPELLSQEPSAHLEAIAVTADARGSGVASALLGAAEQAAAGRGALTMTLHVFANNARARRFYEVAGYDGELLRYIKHLPDDDSKDSAR